MIKTADRLNKISEYYFSQKLKEIDDLNKKGKQIINLGIGSPDLPPHPDVIKTLNEESAKPNQHSYQSYKGSVILRNAISSWYKQWYNVELDPESEILPLIGSKEGIVHLCMTFLNPGDKALVPNPGYPTYRVAVQLAGAECLEYELIEENNWLPDFNFLESLDLSRVKLMWLNYPNMPTGQLSSIEELFEKVIAFGNKHGILICNDNPYSFILNDKPLSLLSVKNAKDTAVELNSLSKSHNMAGWRVGLLAGKAHIINEVLRFKSNMDSGMFLPVQLAAAKALSLPRDWYEGVNIIYRKRRDKAFDLLNILNTHFSKTQAGMFVWAKINDSEKDCYTFVDKILDKAGVFITPGGIFGSVGDRYVRISLCASIEKIDEAIKKSEGDRMVVSVIGPGLIGGSLALTLKGNSFCDKVIGVDSNDDNAHIALQLKIVDKIETLQDAVRNSDFIIIAVPVDAALKVLPDVLDVIDNQTVIDVGSTKEQIVKIASSHPKRKRFVATHPIWGTEYSGPMAAIKDGFKGKVTVICNREESDKDALLLAEKMYDSLGMNKFYMDAVSHDIHAAYVSHISHITSFALALSVLEKEKEEDTIFELAGGGFESTVRLAKSSPDTWIPIFKQNRSNVLDVLNEQIFQLKQMKKLLEMEEFDTLYKLIQQANEIRKILK